MPNKTDTQLHPATSIASLSSHTTLDTHKPVFSLHHTADVEIAKKWNALGGQPGAPKAPGEVGLVQLGSGFIREYANGAIYAELTLGTTCWVHGAIAERYAQLGGPRGALGWPQSDEEDFDGGRASKFQHGAIYWWPDLGALEVGNVVVRYAGLFCFGETADGGSADEPYAILSVIPRLTAQTLTTRTQIYDGVDAGDSREDSIELYRGLPYGLQLSAALMEHDLEDPDKYKETIRVGVEQASKGIALGLAQIPYVGAFVAPVGEALLKAVGPDVVEALDNLVGGADDYIGTVSMFVSARDMVRLAHAARQNLHGILWHLDSPLISDGEGSYKVYLSIEAA